MLLQGQLEKARLQITKMRQFPQQFEHLEKNIKTWKFQTSKINRSFFVESSILNFLPIVLKLKQDTKKPVQNLILN